MRAGTQKKNIRCANGYRRAQVKKRVFAEEDECWLCLRPVDKSLPWMDDFAPELDEVVPVSKGGSPIDRSNVHLAHRICNRTKGNRILARGAFASGFHGGNEDVGFSCSTSRKW